MLYAPVELVWPVATVSGCPPTICWTLTVARDGAGKPGWALSTVPFTVIGFFAV